MIVDELTPAMQVLLGNLHHASVTIESNIVDSLDDAECEEDFVDNAKRYMEGLAQEAYWWGKSILDVANGGEPLPLVMKPMFQIE